MDVCMPLSAPVRGALPSTPPSDSEAVIILETHCPLPAGIRSLLNQEEWNGIFNNKAPLGTAALLTTMTDPSCPTHLFTTGPF